MYLNIMSYVHWSCFVLGYVATEAFFFSVELEAVSRYNEIDCTTYLLHWTFISASTQAHQL